ncbi:Short-chain dehydrogenase [Purpureocillium lavendulum]|uniref:Short-chain dehydrogenase n=1 Tax=Purpureocillium lavendulum TaxID=1247861 RepID=A0AB34G257_9HYPO|nr:Short-chain dehydrogenase [Purpureocillium lavendulum]
MKFTNALFALGLAVGVAAQDKSDAGTVAPPKSLPPADTSVLPIGASLPTTLGSHSTATSSGSGSMSGSATPTASMSSGSGTASGGQATSSSTAGAALPTANALNIAPIVGVALAAMAL